MRLNMYSPIPPYNFIAFQKVEPCCALDLATAPTAKKIVVYVSEGITDINVGDEISTYPTRRFTYHKDGTRIYFIPRTDVCKIINRNFF